MKSILVSGNDTGVGKTWVVGALARKLSRDGARVQVVKPVETGVQEDDSGDAQVAAAQGIAGVEAFRFYAYPKPMAPIEAAKLAGTKLNAFRLVRRLSKLPPCDYRLIEGAGGLAVPLTEKGQDWADYARVVRASAVVLVVEDRLGAISQGRMLAAYAKAAELPAVLWLNECQPCDPVIRASNRAALAQLSYPLVAIQDAGSPEPQWIVPVEEWV